MRSSSFGVYLVYLSGGMHVQLCDPVVREVAVPYGVFAREADFVVFAVIAIPV